MSARAFITAARAALEARRDPTAKIAPVPTGPLTPAARLEAEVFIEAARAALDARKARLEADVDDDALMTR